jgi:excisionase family DNA binding protein
MRNIDKNKLNPSKMQVLPEGWEIFKTYNLQQAAAMLGVSDKTLKKLAENGEIQHRRVGRRWIFSDRALREWLYSDDGKKNA